MTEESTRSAVHMLGLVFIDVLMSGTFPTPAPALQLPFANLVPSDPSLKNQKNGYRGWEQREGKVRGEENLHDKELGGREERKRDLVCERSGGEATSGGGEERRTGKECCCEL